MEFPNMPDVIAGTPAAPASPEASDEIASGVEGGATSEEIASDPDAALAAEEDGPKAPAKKKLKLGDKEFEFDEEQAALIEERDKVYQKRTEHIRAANKKFEEAAALAKRFEGISPELVEALRTGDPFAVARANGQDPDALVTEYARRKLAEMEMSPEQRQAQQRQAQLDARDNDLKQREQKIQQANYQREVQQVQAEFAKNLPPALEKFNLPDDEFTAREVGAILAQQSRSGQANDYDEAAEIVAERLESQLTRYLDRLSRNPGALMKKFPEIAKRLREEDVASVTSPRTAVRPGKPATAPRIQPSAPKTWAEDEREAKSRMYAELGNRR